ncbi:MAG: antitoxin family protein [Candidatus Brocadia sp.]|nr:antitoxin family protein [Candidatus Brocadia sp.]
MREIVKAIYENGVIKPLKELDIKEHEMLTVVISKKVKKTRVKTLALSIVGVFDSGIGDLSQKH